MELKPCLKLFKSWILKIILRHKHWGYNLIEKDEVLYKFPNHLQIIDLLRFNKINIYHLRCQTKSSKNRPHIFFSKPRVSHHYTSNLSQSFLSRHRRALNENWLYIA